MHEPDINLNDDMEQDTSVETATICDNDFYIYDAQGDHGLCKYLEQESSIEVEIPNETDNNEETQYTSDSSCQTGMCII